MVEWSSVAVDVTILADKDSAIRFCFVRSQSEGNSIVIEGGRFPVCGGMAGIALCAEGASMHVVLGMAGVTVFGCAFEYAVDVAA